MPEMTLQDGARRSQRGFSAPRSLSAREPKTLGRRRILAFRVLAHFAASRASSIALRAETDTAAGRVGFEDHDLDVGADGERAGDVSLPRHAGLAHRDETRAPGARNTKTPNSRDARLSP